MKALIKTIILGTILSLFVGCASTGMTGQTELLAKTAVQFAVLKITDKHPEKAARVLSIATEIQAIAGTDGFNTVDALIAVIKTKANFSKLDPATQLLAGALIDELSIQLKQRIGNGTINTTSFLEINKVAGWVKDAASLATVQQPTG